MSPTPRVSSYSEAPGRMVWAWALHVYSDGGDAAGQRGDQSHYDAAVLAWQSWGKRLC